MKIKARRHLTLGTFKVLALSGADFNIKENTPADIIAKLKEKEAHPFLQAYVICHEGEFTPEIVGEKSVPIVWSEDSVKTFSGINVIGKKLFYGHDTREVLGEIVHSTFKTIGGKDCFVVIAHHPADKAAKAAECDICSQEAEWETIEFQGKIYADKVNELFGVAIQKSQNDTPAFSGAKKIASIYANEANKPEEKKQMTVGEVLQGIKDLNIMPYQAFDFEAIKNDPVFSKKIPDIEPLKKELDEKAAKIKELSENTEALKISVAKTTAKQRLDKIVKDKNLTEQQKAFLYKQYDEYESEDYTDDGLTSFADKTIKIYQNAVSTIPADKKPAAKPEEGEPDSYVDDNLDIDEILGG